MFYLKTKIHLIIIKKPPSDKRIEGVAKPPLGHFGIVSATPI
jgi:hypothetical protein